MTSVLAPPIESDEELQQLYNWIDEMPLSRPKRNISRDFSDGVLFAEALNYFFPNLVEMHNYSSANSQTQKMYNWNTLNTKAVKKLGYMIHRNDVDEIVRASPGAIERVLHALRDKVLQAQRGQLKVNLPKAPGAGSVDGRSDGHSDRRSVPSGDGLIARSRQVIANKADVASVQGSVPAPYNGGQMQRQQQHQQHDARSQQSYQQDVDTELLVEKEQTIVELREMVVIMSEKIKKLEQLVRIKDSKIDALNSKLQKHGIA